MPRRQWTPEQAVAFAAIATAAASQRREELRRAVADTLPQGSNPNVPQKALSPNQLRLARIRENLCSLDHWIAKTCRTRIMTVDTARKVKELCQATAVLEEQERRLSGRPLPPPAPRLKLKEPREAVALPPAKIEPAG